MQMDVGGIKSKNALCSEIRASIIWESILDVIRDLKNIINNETSGNVF